MARSISLKFDGPYEYEQAIRAANVTGFVAEKGDFKATLTQVDFSRLWLQGGSEQVGRSNHVAVPKARSPVFFIAGPKQGRFEISGQDLKSSELVLWGEDASHYLRTTNASSWGAMSLPTAHLPEVSYALGGEEVVPSANTKTLTPGAGHMARLVSLHQSATSMASTTPDMLAHPEISRALEQALTEVMIKCLVGAESANPSIGSRRHQRVMAGFEEWLSINRDRPAYLAEVCVALKVSQRTLNICCHEQLGLSPTRYLWLRRMHLARQELLRATPETTTIAQAAMNLGFWELGRFSVSYKAIFGESPSVTLQRPQQAPQRSTSAFVFPA